MNNPTFFSRLAACSVRVTCLAALVLTVTSSGEAGPILEAYHRFTTSRYEVRSAEFLALAAQEEVRIAQLEYLPLMSLEAEHGIVSQYIATEGVDIFLEGADSYQNSLVKAELDQPLLDLTLGPKVKAAKATHFVMANESRLKEEENIELFLTTLLNAARFVHLERAMDRVIQRLEDESSTVQQNFAVKLATLEDVENVRAAAAEMRQEKLTFRQEIETSLFELGLTPGQVDALVLGRHLEISIEGEAPLLENPDIRVIEAEIEAYESRIKEAKMKDAPRLSLYGLFEYDNADGSVFGGEGTLQAYEVGLAVRWNFFDRGMSRAEVRKLQYLKMAKQAEMDALPRTMKPEIDFASKVVDLTRQTLDTYEDQLIFQKTIMEATERSYNEGGDKSYVNMINAFLTYEALERERIQGQFNYLQAQLELAAKQWGWTTVLVEELDSIFSEAQERKE